MSLAPFDDNIVAESLSAAAAAASFSPSSFPAVSTIFWFTRFNSTPRELFVTAAAGVCLLWGHFWHYGSVDCRGDVYVLFGGSAHDDGYYSGAWA